MAELEALSEEGKIDLYYGDQTGVSTEGYCPCGWQGKEEKVSVAALPLFFLPPCSPHLNIAETLWRMLKGKWPDPVDYLSAEALFYAATKCLDAVGKNLNIQFSNSTHN